MSKMTILRGISGSGKSTKASNMSGTVVSADHYFIQKNGEYVFNGKELGIAHEDCKQKAREAISRRENVIVDNTNTMLWEMIDYISMAKEAEMELEIVDIFDGGCSDEELAERNKHGVPLESIKDMRARYEHDLDSASPIPPWER
jgi:predicted kinase